MTNYEQDQIAERLSRASLAFILPIRAEKKIDDAALSELKNVLGDLRIISSKDGILKREIADLLLSTFGQVLAEATHAKLRKIRRESKRPLGIFGLKC